MENQSLQELAEQVKQDNFNALAQHAAIIQELNVVDAIDVKETDFKKYFLPMFKKEIELTEDNINTFINNIYILTNSYNKPIQIVTDDLKDKLFKLPPITMNIKDSELLHNINFYKLINKYNVISESNNPMLESKALTKLTNAVSNVLAPDENDVNEYTKDILFMYKRYNIPYLKDEKGNVQEVSSNDTIIDEEVEFDYDDD